MAAQGNKRKNSNTSSKSGNNKRTNSKSTTARSKTTPNRKPNNAKPSIKSSSTKADDALDKSKFIDFWHAFSRTRFFRPIMTILIIDIVVLIDLLFAWNDYTKFFIILGCEIILIAIFSVFKLAIKITNDINEDNPSGS